VGILEEEFKSFCPIFKKFIKLIFLAWKASKSMYNIDWMENMQRELHCSRISPNYVVKFG
jgi:hypothetical protein